ncbi:MAG: START domain-containing protein [Chlorobium sp.]
MDVSSILDGNWEFRVEHKGIKVFSSLVSGSDIYGFKGEVELVVPLKKLLSLFNDMANYTRWVRNLAVMEVLEEVDATEYVVRQVISLPWPMQEREVIMRTRLVSSGENGLAIVMKEEPEYLPLNPQYHRVLHATGGWVFTPNGHGVVLVTFVMHLDPGKDVPAAASNAGMFDVPFYTLNTLRNLLQDKSYSPPWPVALEQFVSIIEDAPDTP